MSDFHATIAAIHEGRCPLCDGELVPVKIPTPTHADDDEPFVDGLPRCDPCDVEWRIQGMRDLIGEHETVIGMGPMIVASRKLTDEERRRLYNRGG